MFPKQFFLPRNSFFRAPLRPVLKTNQKFEPYFYFLPLYLGCFSMNNIPHSGSQSDELFPYTRSWMRTARVKGSSGIRKSLEMNVLNDQWLSLILAIAISSQEGVLVICYCVTSYPQIYQLIIIIILYFIVCMGQQSEHGLPWYLRLRVSDKVVLKLLGLQSHLRLEWGGWGLFFQDRSHGWQALVPDHMDLSIWWLHNMAPDFSRGEGSRGE